MSTPIRTEFELYIEAVEDPNDPLSEKAKAAMWKVFMAGSIAYHHLIIHDVELRAASAEMKAFVAETKARLKAAAKAAKEATRQ
jgi:hypothetical protein